MTLYISLVLSLAFNLLLIWYIRQLLTSHKELGEFTENILNDLKTFEDHLKTVYELERFFGDSTLSGLLEHVSDLSKNIKRYREFFVFQRDEQDYEQEEE
jgi:hypothetical protein